MFKVGHALESQTTDSGADAAFYVETTEEFDGRTSRGAGHS
jgi:hypothetical protein